MLRTFRFQLRPSGPQARVLSHWLAVSCELYNAALQERREAWHRERRRVGYYGQAAQLTELRQIRKDVESIPVEVAREPLRRLHRAFRGFFQRCKAGQKPGYPRFRSCDGYDSLAFSAAEIGRDLLCVPKLGCVRFRKHREIKGQSKTCVIRRAPGGRKWSVSMACDLGPAPEKRPLSSAVGMDVGLTTFVTLSDGSAIEKPKWAAEADRKIAAAHPALARKQRRSSESQNRSAERPPAGREPAAEFLPSCL